MPSEGGVLLRCAFLILAMAASVAGQRPPSLLEVPPDLDVPQGTAAAGEELQAPSLPDAPSDVSVPDVPEGPGEATSARGLMEDLSTPIKIVLVLTFLTLLPAVLMTVTSFTRIVIVLGFVRRALSVQEVPPNQVVIGLALFLTVLIMHPVISEVNEKALQPYLDEEITLSDAAGATAESLSGFLLHQTREDDVVAMLDLTGTERPEKADGVPLHVLVPAFALSELRTAFQMGFLIYLPFLVVDMVVASVLLSMGMFMLPPIIISTPFKILLFILVDGWELVVSSVVKSFAA